MTILSKSAFALSIAAAGALALPTSAFAQSAPVKSAEQSEVGSAETAPSTEAVPANHNTTRSNRKAGGLAGSDASGGGDDVGNGATRATDYNSSRSNKSYAAPADLDGGDSDSSTGGNRATDYNSSRSNKADTASVASEDELIAVDGDTTKTGRNPQTGKEIKSPN